MTQTHAHNYFLVTLLAFALCALITEAQVPDSQKQALLSMAGRYWKMLSECLLLGAASD